MVFQDPMTSLNPVRTIGEQIAEVIMWHFGKSHDEAKKETVELLRKVGIQDPEKRYKQYPGEFSGGMRQRVVIATAIACRPEILICDEPTTALDVTVQAQVLDLIKSLQKELKMSVVFITHDLGVVANVADWVAVM
jgi:oligopeptide transport system ATP-binding protein